MDAYELIDIAPVVEPISLAEAKAYCMVDQDYTQVDDIIKNNIVSARVYLESQLNVGLAERELIVNWPGTLLNLPLSPVKEIVSITEGERVLDDAEFTQSSYKAKSVYVNEVVNSTCDYWYSMIGQVSISCIRPSGFHKMYTCKYIAGHLVLPKDLKDAMAMHLVYLFQQRGAPDLNPANSGALRMAISHSKNLLL